MAACLDPTRNDQSRLTALARGTIKIDWQYRSNRLGHTPAQSQECLGRLRSRQSENQGKLVGYIVG